MTKFADYIKEDEAEGLKDFESMADEAAQPAAEVLPAAPRFTIPEWLKAETGPGHIDEYVTHVFNFNKSTGLARVIRGLTGMFGSLNFAVVDIFLGVLEMGRERKAKLPTWDGVVRDHATGEPI